MTRGAIESILSSIKLGLDFVENDLVNSQIIDDIEEFYPYIAECASISHFPQQDYDVLTNAGIIAAKAEILLSLKKMKSVAMEIVTVGDTPVFPQLIAKGKEDINTLSTNFKGGNIELNKKRAEIIEQLGKGSLMILVDGGLLVAMTTISFPTDPGGPILSISAGLAELWFGF